MKKKYIILPLLLITVGSVLGLWIHTQVFYESCSSMISWTTFQWSSTFPSRCQTKFSPLNPPYGYANTPYYDLTNYSYINLTFYTGMTHSGFTGNTVMTLYKCNRWICNSIWSRVASPISAQPNIWVTLQTDQTTSDANFKFTCSSSGSRSKCFFDSFSIDGYINSCDGSKTDYIYNCSHNCSIDGNDIINQSFSLIDGGGNFSFDFPNLQSKDWYLFNWNNTTPKQCLLYPYEV